MALLSIFVFDGNGLGKSYSHPFTACNFTLPVELTSFTGKAVNKTSELKWTTEAESNLDSYELQRSPDGVNFTSIAIAFAKNSQRNNYAYTDIHPYDGSNFYRLKMIEKDGSYKYSNVVVLHFGDIKNIQAVIAPNPVKTNINLQIKGMETGVYKIEITNAIGQSQLNKKITISQSNHTETINTPSSISNGIYYLSIYNENNIRVKSLSFIINK